MSGGTLLAGRGGGGRPAQSGGRGRAKERDSETSAASHQGHGAISHTPAATPDSQLPPATIARGPWRFNGGRGADRSRPAGIASPWQLPDAASIQTLTARLNFKLN